MGRRLGGIFRVKLGLSEAFSRAARLLKIVPREIAVARELVRVARGKEGSEAERKNGRVEHNREI